MRLFTDRTKGVCMYRNLCPHTPEALYLLVPGSPLRAQFDLLYVNVFFWRPELG